MNLTVVGAAERDRIFVANFAAQGSRLHEAQVMRLGGLPLAPKAWLRRHELQMGTIAVAARLAQRKRALVDMANNGYGWCTGIDCSINVLSWVLRDNARFLAILILTDCYGGCDGG